MGLLCRKVRLLTSAATITQSQRSAPDPAISEFKLSFHGRIEMQHLLPHVTPDAVAAEVRRCCEVLRVGGGYILARTAYFNPMCRRKIFRRSIARNTRH